MNGTTTTERKQTPSLGLCLLENLQGRLYLVPYPVPGYKIVFSVNTDEEGKDDDGLSNIRGSEENMKLYMYSKNTINVLMIKLQLLKLLYLCVKEIVDSDREE